MVFVLSICKTINQQTYKHGIPVISIFSTFKIPLPKEAKEAEEKAAKAAEAEAPEEQAVAQLH